MQSAKQSIAIRQEDGETELKLFQKLCTLLINHPNPLDANSILVEGFTHTTKIAKPLKALTTNSHHNLCKMPPITYAMSAEGRIKESDFGDQDWQLNEPHSESNQSAFASCFLLNTVYDLHRLDSWTRTLRSMRKIYNDQGYLRVIETGISRDNSSTDVFALLASRLPNITVETHDINRELCHQARARYAQLITKKKLSIHEGDSIKELDKKQANPRPNCLYLDSYDLDFANPDPSSLHHLMEFLRLEAIINPEGTLVVVDDTPFSNKYIREYHRREDFALHQDESWTIANQIPGKGSAILSYLSGNNCPWEIESYFHSYQLNLVLKRTSR